MKKLTFRTGPLLILALLACCTPAPSMIANPRSGETASCAITALSRAIADDAAGVCRRNYEAAGWVAVPGPVAITDHSAGL
jgi:hypothetical protein